MSRIFNLDLGSNRASRCGGSHRRCSWFITMVDGIQQSRAHNLAMLHHLLEASASLSSMLALLCGHTAPSPFVRTLMDRQGIARSSKPTRSPRGRRHSYLLTGRAVLWLSTSLVATRLRCCNSAGYIIAAPKVLPSSLLSRRGGGVYFQRTGGSLLQKLSIFPRELLQLYSSSSSSSNGGDKNNMWVRLDSPPAQRNKEPIWQVMASEILPKLTVPEVMQAEGADPAVLIAIDDERSTPPLRPPLRVLEIAAGCGVHTQYFCQLMKKAGWKDFVWYPTDPDATSRASIQSYLDEADLADVVAPLPLTLGAYGIEEADTRKALLHESLDLMICINMIHISPWEATVGLMKTAQEKLRPGGFLYCYGPYKVNGMAVESNLAFDRNLRLRDPSWGVRDLEKVQQLALECGLEFVKSIAMPANNLSLLFRKQES